MIRITSATDQSGTIRVDGEAVKATIAQPGAIASLTFAGTAGQKVYITVDSSNVPNTCGALILRGPDGGAINQGCIINGGGGIDATVLPTAGQYAIDLDLPAEATGEAVIRITSTDAIHSLRVPAGSRPGAA